MSFLALSVCIVSVVSAAEESISTRSLTHEEAPFVFSTKSPIVGSTKAPAPTPFSEPLFWNQFRGTINGPGAYDDHLGGAVDSSANGRIVAYGARYDSTCEAGFRAGTVRVSYYDSESSEWKQLGQTLYGEGEEDYFGKSVKLSANGYTLAVSANAYKTSDGDGAGYFEVYKYKKKKKTWKRLGKRITSEGMGDESGWGLSLSADGMTVAVGSYAHDGPSDNNNNIGQTRIFRFDDTDWVQRGKSIYGEVDSRDGTSVDLSADGMMVVIGGPETVYGLGKKLGRARVFKYINDKWRQKGDDLIGKTDGGEMGLAVSISGDGKTVAISAGCYYYCEKKPGNDRVKVYKFKAGTWNKVGESIYREDNESAFAKAISLSEDGNTIALNAMRGDSDDYTAEGLAKVYNLVDGKKWKKLGQSVIFHPHLFGYNGDNSDNIALSANGRVLVVGSSEKKNSNVKVFRLGSYKDTPPPTQSPTASTKAPIAAPSTKAPKPTLSPRPSLPKKYWGEKGQILAPDEPGFYNTGFSVASSKEGNIIAINSDFESGPPTGNKKKGSAMIYKFNLTSNVWETMGKRIFGNPDESSFGVSMALSAQGTHFAIGSTGYDGDRGRVNIYSFDEGDWLQLGQSLVGKCRKDSVGWGLSLSTNGEIIAVGGYNGGKNTDDDNTANSEQGYTMIYKYKNKRDKWLPLGKKIFGETPDEEDGTSVDLSGDGKTVIIGGPYFGKGYLGRARVFKLIKKTVAGKAENTWEQVAKDMIGEVGEGEYGTSVSMSLDGSVIAVGSGCYYFCNQNYVGYVDVFKINKKDTKWKQLGNRIFASKSGYKDFGNSVSLSNDGKTVAFGAIESDGKMSTKVFQFNNKKWDKVGETIYGGGDYSQYSSQHVALSGDASTLVVGDREENKATVYTQLGLPS